MKVPGSAPLACSRRRWLFALASLVLFSCRVAPPPETSEVEGGLRAVRDEDTLAISDTLEVLIANGDATDEDRAYAYHLIKDRQEKTAGDAFGHAQITARLAQVEGLAARGLISDIEAQARKSIALDADFRRGAAQRLLGTLYVMAPARLLEHGDSEVGLELLEALADRYPNDALTRLRLGEAYVSLDDPEGAEPHLCYALAHRGKLTREQQEQLDRLAEDAGIVSCTDN